VTAMLHATLPARDLAFQAKYVSITAAAYSAGSAHVHAQIGHALAEAKKPVLTFTDTHQVKNDVDSFEDGTDDTTGDRLESTLAGVKPFEYAAVVGAVKTLFNEFSKPPEGDTSRGESTAVTVVSGAYHDGGADLAAEVAQSGQQVEKHWDAEDDACPVCLDNESEDWIPEDATHSSGDDEPPAHPNCRCSESYRVGE
jgi:hypothetical protein